MNFEFSEDQKFVQKSARDLLAKESPLSSCRAVLEGGKSHDPSLWKVVAENGYVGAVIPEEFGGAGMGYLELALLAEEIGRALAPIPFSHSVYLATEALLHCGSDAQKKKWLPKLASGEAIGAFALDEGLGETQPGEVATKLAGGKLTGTKLAVAGGDVAQIAIVAAKDDAGKPTLALVELGASGVTRTPSESFDGSRSQASLAFKGAAAEALPGANAQSIDHLLDRAALLFAFEQIGGAERALEITREFTLGRYAFGRPVASFQVLKHKMADVYCAIEIARSNAYYGAWALHANQPAELSLAAPASKVAASDAFTQAAEEMIQLHGGVGFTWEYDCHLFYRRARFLAQTLGSPSAWREKLVARLETREISEAGAGH
jgi:alkylation response protein AidB-like acyl-CoA dehydrogenase